MHISASKEEGAVVTNLKRKESAAKSMGESLAKETSESVKRNVLGGERTTNTYNANQTIKVPSFLEAV